MYNNNSNVNNNPNNNNPNDLLMKLIKTERARKRDRNIRGHLDEIDQQKKKRQEISNNHKQKMKKILSDLNVLIDKWSLLNTSMKLNMKINSNDKTTFNNLNKLIKSKFDEFNTHYKQGTNLLLGTQYSHYKQNKNAKSKRYERLISEQRKRMRPLKGNNRKL